MKKLMFGLMAVSLLVFGTGCGGDVGEGPQGTSPVGGGDLCEDAAYASEGLRKKVTNCPEIGDDYSGVVFTDARIAECKQQSKTCSDSEMDKMNDVIDCINDLPSCKQGEERAWILKLRACGAKGETVTCMDAWIYRK